jgi:predicted dehydrogenase
MPKRPTFSVGLIGTKFMGKAHSNAWRQVTRFFDLGAEIRMATICGRDRAATKRAADKLGWQSSTTDWRKVIADSQIDIVDICTPNDLHAEIAIAAARAGKAILCEKPLARDVGEAERMVEAVRRARVVNMVCHNYRRVPAIALAKQMIEAGELGHRIYHYHARYAQDWIANEKFPRVWRLQSRFAGSGALGDIGAHVIDLARYLVGEIDEISAMSETFVKRRPLEIKKRVQGRIDVDDAVAVIGKFRNGALLNFEATRLAHGHKNQLTFEINGSAGSVAFDLEQMNCLHFFRTADPIGRQGFCEILVTEPSHPYVARWWPPGHLIGYEHTFVHTIADFVNAVVTKKTVRPSFADGLRNQRVMDAIMRSRHRRCWIKL